MFEEGHFYVRYDEDNVILHIHNMLYCNDGVFFVNLKSNKNIVKQEQV